MHSHGEPPHLIEWDKNGKSLCCDIAEDLALMDPAEPTAEPAFASVIRARVENITMQALDQVERAITTGTPQTRSNMITRVLPVLIKATTTDESVDAEIEGLKLVQREIMKAIHESVPPAPAPEDPGP